MWSILAIALLPHQRGDAAALMRARANGTCKKKPAQVLRWAVEVATADNICCFNRHYAEGSQSFATNTQYMSDLLSGGEVTYYDSITSKPLFVAPRGRSMESFLEESRQHGWPSFRDAEVIWDNVRVLSDGETVSIDGTHVRQLVSILRPLGCPILGTLVACTAC